MDPVGVNSIETAALGRPFQLGMLYDCRRDALVPGIRLWSKEQLQQNINTKPQINTVFAVTASDSAEDKSRLLDIDGCLKLSFLGGLINVSGAANFLKDTKKSFNQQRLTLHYHSTTKFEELIMNHFPSGEMAHDNDVATHVVTAVLYGADACFVFDREVSSDEDKRVIAGEVKAVFGKLKGISAGANINLNDNQRTAAQKFSCTFYGDFQLPCNPTSFEDAMKVFEDLPKLLGENKELAIPLKVWLYPLDRLFSRVVKFQHEISIGLSTDIESVIEHLSTTEMKCSDLLTDTPALTFTAFHDKINEMKKNCYQCRLSLMKKLGSLLPKIRGKFIEETALIDLLNDHKESPFESSLAQWLEMKEEESDIIKSLFTQLNDSGAMVEKLNKNLMHLKVTHVVIYMFTSLGWPDVLLSKQKAYLSSVKENEDKSSESEHKTWLTSEIQKTMRNNLEVFKKLIDLNVSKSVKFIVASKEMENSPGSCILLYENGCNEAVRFTPPSKPDCPVIEDVRCRQVILKVSPPCPATEELKLLYKMKEEKDWTSQTVSKNQNTVTLTDLRPDTEYSIKCAAVGKLNYTVDSDVTRLTVINQNLIKAKESATENLCWTENKCSVLLGNTKETTFTALYKKIQEELKLLYKMKEEKDWTSQTMSKNQNTVTLTDLRPDTQYSIKCAAVGKLNYITESDVTTVITKDKNKLIMKTILIKDGNPARYRLQTRTDNLCQSETYRKITFGERSKNKPHKTILLVGETGTGKTTLIDTMINYMLDVKRKDKVWFEITDDQSDRTQQHTQTTIITVYEFYLQESPIDLTIIDTPGYGNTDGVEFDKQIAVSLLSLSKSTKGIHEIDAVCLVIYATQNRLSYRTMYIFDAVQSLFGRDIAENIVLLFTRSDGAPPKNALTAVKEAQIKCAVNYKNQPVFFLFDNCQSDEADEEYEITQKQSWYRSFRGMTGLFEFLDTIKPKSLVMTRDVLQQQKQLEAAVSNLHLHVQMMGLKQNELKQTQEVLEQNKEHVKDNKNFEYEVKVPYKEKVDIDHSKAKMATCCTVCEENCVYPDSGWVRNRSWFNAMKNDHCTVCTNKCHYSKHVKGAKIYVTKTKIEKRTYEDLKKKYVDKIGDGVFVAKKLEEELQELEKEKIKLVNEAFDCVEMLQKITLNIDSLIILQHIDFLTEKLKEVNEPEKAQTLENIKKTAGKEKHGALEYFFKNKLK
ncbi:stonustoxin subunit beta-like protein [Labeo rohita]|uniref:Stonustoxin subunit beta-like protein n=1 Tax=Labeo rohita TaxID=84645 RepID=A0A498LXV7_LABRO|nr:stonustoxin subunit beta-like protein [Labeo rohita]